MPEETQGRILQNTAVKNTHIINTSKVSGAIAALGSLTIHPHFAGYLVVKRESVKSGAEGALAVNFKNFYDEYFRVNLTPKPYLKIFNDTQLSADNCWFNENIAGSYAPSSLRPGAPFLRMVDVSTNPVRYTLRPDRVERIAQILNGVKIPAAELAAFLFRDYGFTGTPANADSLVKIFKNQFGYTGTNGEAEFERIYSLPSDQEGWFNETENEPSTAQSTTEELRLTQEKVRHLTAEEMMLPAPSNSAAGDSVATAELSELSEESTGPLDESALYSKVVKLLDQGFGGIIFTGPPGTGKSYSAETIGNRLVNGDATRFRSIQFHASYQYEDFVEGFIPNEDGNGFQLKPKHLLEMADIANQNSKKNVVLVIDELSRTDPSRIFGEALTYLESSKRGKDFYLSTGRKVNLPANLIILATMNPQDRGAEEVDAALERRFAKIEMPPREDLLQHFLNSSELSSRQQSKLMDFYRYVNSPEYNCQLGHVFFMNAVTQHDFDRLWEHQLRFFFDRAFPLDRTARARIDELWADVFVEEGINDTQSVDVNSDPDGAGTPQ